MEFDLENPFIRNEEDSILDLFASESEHMSLFDGGGNLPSRHNAVSLIFQMQFARNLDPFLIYLAINYVDRYLSKRKVPIEKLWILRLLGIACISLAAKMKKLEFRYADLQMGEASIFDAQTINRMEIHVLNALEWRMRSITPHCFVDYFLNFFVPAQQPYICALKNRCVELLLKAQNKTEILEFKPSVVAASALIVAADELFPVQYYSFKSAISNSQLIDNEKLCECTELMNDVAAMDCEVISSCETPITVLYNGKSNVSDESISDGPVLKKHKTE